MNQNILNKEIKYNDKYLDTPYLKFKLVYTDFVIYDHRK